MLRDGSVVTIRTTDPADHDALRRFFHELSPESRRLRFFSLAEPSDSLIDRLCDSRDPRRALTLLAIRSVDGEPRPIAVGSYIGEGDGSAEAAFAVDDRFHGKGLGTVLLERLAAAAASHGLRRFEALTLPENAAMLDVFHESGFEIRSKSDYGAITVHLSLSPTRETVAALDRRNALATVASLTPLFQPRAVAVIGASRKPASIGRRVLRGMTASGFTGAVYPINPHAKTLDGLVCYPSMADAPPGIDLAVICVPRPLVLTTVDQCAAAGVKSLVVITAGFAEAGEEGRALQQQLVEKVRGYGMRLVGPNCMGIINATDAVRLNASFSPVMPPSGHIALSSQSGALGLAILQLATERGLGLSTFVSVGNKADVSGNDLLQYLGGRPRDRGHPPVSRVVRQSAALRAAGAADRPQETDCRGQSRTDPRRIAGGRQPHRSARRQRRRGRCAVPPVGRHPRRHHRRDVRHRRAARDAAAAAGTPHRDRHQRRRAGHSGGRRLRGRGTVGDPILGGHADPAVRLSAARGERRQSGRHGRVGRTGGVSSRRRSGDDGGRSGCGARDLHPDRDERRGRDARRHPQRHRGRAPRRRDRQTGGDLRHVRRTPLYAARGRR